MISIIQNCETRNRKGDAIIEQRARRKNIIRFELESYDANKLTLLTSKLLKKNSNVERLREIDSMTGGARAGSRKQVGDRGQVESAVRCRAHVWF